MPSHCAIGLSNFQPDRLVDIKVFHEVPPAVNQIETHPLLQQADGVNFMRGNGVHAQAWAPFAEGRNNLFQNANPMAIGARYGKSVGPVALRWMGQRGTVSLAKPVRNERIVENLIVFDFELTDEDVAWITEPQTAASSFVSHRDPAIVKWMSERRLPFSSRTTPNPIHGSSK
jgi:2,5-diketo-D-gluconate reductase A